MQINFLGGPKPKPDLTITHLDVWYDAETFKTWVLTRYNKDGDQVGESTFQHYKCDTVSTAKIEQEMLGGSSRVTLSISKKDGSYPK